MVYQSQVTGMKHKLGCDSRESTKIVESTDSIYHAVRASDPRKSERH